MYKFSILLSVFIVPTALFGQVYYTTDVIKKADSLIIAAVGATVFNNHFQLDSSAHDAVQVTYDKERKIKPIVITSKKIRHFTFVAIDYLFFLDSDKQTTVPERIIFDKNLHLQFPVDISFIPKYILEGTKNNMLQKSDVLAIAKAKFVQHGIKPFEATLKYDNAQGIYIWTVINILYEGIDTYKNSFKNIEYLELNASDGKILTYHANAIQGAVY